jgi:hypothetical protein
VIPDCAKVGFARFVGMEKRIPKFWDQRTSWLKNNQRVKNVGENQSQKQGSMIN